MQSVNKNILIISVILFAFSLISPTAVFAATTPSLGAAASYGVLSSTYTDTSGATTVNGSVGFTTPPGSAIGGTHTYYGSGAPYSTAGTDQGTALTALNNQGCDFSYGSAQDLSLLPQPLVAGVHCTTGAMSIGTGGNHSWQWNLYFQVYRCA